MNKRFAAIALVLGIGATAACSSGSSTTTSSTPTPTPTPTASSFVSDAATSSSGTTDPCALLSAADVQQALGTAALRAATPITGPNGEKGCRTATSDTAHLGFVSITIFSTTANASTLDQVKATYPDAKPESGIGDQAVASLGFGAIGVRVGADVFAITVSLPGGTPAGEATLVALAKTAAGHVG